MCFATNLLVMQQVNEVKNSPKSLWLGVIGTPEVKCYCNSLEVNSDYTGSI